MFCGIIDFFSPTTSFRALRLMGETDSYCLPCASAYLSGGVGLFTRNRDTFLTYPLTKTIEGKSYVLMLEGTPDNIDEEEIIRHFSNEGESLLTSLCGDFALALFDSSKDTLYLLRGCGGTHVYFSGDIRLVFATSEEALAAFPEKLYGISRLRENSILKYDLQGVRLI